MGPKWARWIFFLLIQTLPTFWAARIWILRIFGFFPFLDFWTAKLPGPLEVSEIVDISEISAPECPPIDFRAPRGPDVDLCYVFFQKINIISGNVESVNIYDVMDLILGRLYFICFMFVC